MFRGIHANQFSCRYWCGDNGSSIAQVCAQANWKTNLYDAFPKDLKGYEEYRCFWDKGIARGKTTQEQKVAWSSNLFAVSNMETAVKEVDLLLGCT